MQVLKFFFGQYFRPSQILTQLSSSLVLWQDFIEIRAELEHELAQEQDLLKSIKANISCNESLRAKLEAEHDLKVKRSWFTLHMISNFMAFVFEIIVPYVFYNNFFCRFESFLEHVWHFAIR